MNNTQKKDAPIECNKYYLKFALHGLAWSCTINEWVGWSAG